MSRHPAAPRSPTPPVVMRARARLLRLLPLCGALLAGGCSVPPPAEAPRPAHACPPRAAAGDTVYVIQYAVRAEKREQFEGFLAESYWPALRAAEEEDPALACVAEQTRVLAPLRAGSDGTLIYAFVMDPVVSGYSYNVLDLLRRTHAPEEADRRYRLFTESWAHPFVSLPFVQAGSAPAEAPDSLAAGG